ncbi:propeptide PepSY amd peptidase M4 [Methylophaga lonarensis MPL]|uniref:Propeptide PepSY amd peptidase M4 n=1 Tax=Methylophaga lonarensis MPL TaxID=1286106 RepID=M7P1W1_9GAMM|nr:PepSY domain-containing protein [Methylophaga lonarensis]EMR13481.1 propeptide PepSY amd peptidase M4 [Methylophaga lonarensis MPL]
MKSNKSTLAALISAAVLFAPALAQANKHDSALDKCVASAMELHPGTILGMRAELENGKRQYELDIAGNDGQHWEVECSAKSGEILEVEREVAPNDPEFTSKAKVRLDEALKTALDAYPGAVMKIEYEIEADDSVSYEFDILMADGKLMEVEVDAVTGALKDPEEVLYQIGQ